MSSSLRLVILATPLCLGGLSSSVLAQAPPRVQLPTVVVTAQKEPADPNTLPVSVTAVPRQTLDDGRVSVPGDAAVRAPNVFFNEFTARKLSNVFVRGVGSSPANPGVTTFYDGVPQLSANSSSLELVDVDQIEFVRGPQGALFGRNTLGGFVSVASARPSTTRWTGAFNLPFGNAEAIDARGTLSGPLVADRLAMSASFGGGRRDGFTTNTRTGNDLDSRSGRFGKVQLLWTPTSQWEARVIVAGERDRDGDYALQDLAALRQAPFTVARDFEGFTERDVMSTTVLARRAGARVVLSSTTGFVRWTTRDVTDLDYTPLPLVTRDNAEEDFHFTQEIRLASADQAALRLSDRAALKWQGGVFLFTQNYEQEAVNSFAPFLLSPFLGFPVSQTSPQSTLDDRGVGVYGQGTVVLDERLDLSLGARFDREHKEGNLNSAFTPAIAPPTVVDVEDTFSQVSPQLSAAYRLRPNHTVYATVAGGFKAGGFNAASPAGSEMYGEERSLNVESGVKALFADGRVSASAALFFIDWNDLQLNLPDPLAPGRFYIANAGDATSRGIEAEVTARVHPSLDLFGVLGLTRARFSNGTVIGGVDVGDNELPNAPDYTAMLGAQARRTLTPSATLFGRAEVVLNGAFHYDERNREAQDAYVLTHMRGGVQLRQFVVEAWVKNAFDTRYIPVAFTYDAFAPSGFVGESGRPRTFGMNLGVRF